MTGALIQTSNAGWAKRLAVAYKGKQAVRLVDDAKLGIDPRVQTIFEMTKRAGLSTREMVGVGVAGGMGIVGTGLIAAAFFDPEPTSKLGLAMGGGIALVATGGLSAYRVLTNTKPPTIRCTPAGALELSWD